MSERITEAELVAMESAGKLGWAGSANAINTTVLVAEVRRLRGLIASLEASEPAEGVLHIGGGLVELVREARAIREEQGR